MIRLGTIAKLARAKVAPGGIGPDELAEMLAELAGSFGMELETVPVPPDGMGEAFHHAASATQQEGSKLVVLSGKMKSGDTLEALIVLSPAKVAQFIV